MADPLSKEGEQLHPGDCARCRAPYPHCDCWRDDDDDGAEAQEALYTAMEIIDHGK